MANSNGYTEQLTNVYEGNEIIEKIIGNNNISEIRSRFYTFIQNMKASHTHPLIFKNVRAFSKLSLLHKAVPELNFLRIKRDPEQVIQSVLKAYYELGMFHPIPDKLLNSQISDPLEFAIHQIFEIENSIEIQRNQIDKSVWLEWTYEEFCENTWTMIENLTENQIPTGKKKLRRNALEEPLQVSKRKKVTTEEINKIRQLINQYYKKYTQV